MQINPVTLAGNVVRLEPLRLDHTAALTAVGLDAELWKWIPTPVVTADDMRAYVARALEEQERGVSLPFAIVDAVTNDVIGSTRFGNIERAHKRMEIGWTWYALSHQRTGANTEAKLMLLSHAFDTLGANRVELKTDALNEKSRAAIARIGATQEGIFRQHIIRASGRVRDTVYFSIVRAEWANVKARLQARLQQSNERVRDGVQSARS
jgi:RimJ/RimL family protein N-acetyltransferase